MKAAVVIPARYGSKRFPGKTLLCDPDGKPLLQYIVEAAQSARRVGPVIVATDDNRIRDAVEGFGGAVCMTAPEHRCGSERSAEVAAGLDVEVIVNLQGDEPGIVPEQIDQTVELLEADPEAVVSTLAARIEDPAELVDSNVVKVVLSEKGRALYFSRSPIPFVRDATDPLAESPAPHLKHLGIYAYRRAFLLEYARLGSHPLEEAEKLEQLRALAHGYMISVGLTSHHTLKVDTPEDFEAFVKAFKARRVVEEKG